MSWGWHPKQGGHRTRWAGFFTARWDGKKGKKEESWAGEEQEEKREEEAGGKRSKTWYAGA